MIAKDIAKDIVEIIKHLYKYSGGFKFKWVLHIIELFAVIIGIIYVCADLIYSIKNLINEIQIRLFKVGLNMNESLQQKYTSDVIDIAGFKINNRKLWLLVVVIICLILFYHLYSILTALNISDIEISSKFSSLISNTPIFIFLILLIFKFLQIILIIVNTQSIYTDYDNRSIKLNTIFWSCMDDCYLYYCIKEDRIDSNLLKNLADYISNPSNARDVFTKEYPDLLQKLNGIPNKTYVFDRYAKDMRQQHYNSAFSSLDGVNIELMKYGDVYFRSIMTYSFLIELKKKDEELIDQFIKRFKDDLKKQNNADSTSVSRYNIYNLVSQSSTDIIEDTNLQDLYNTIKEFNPEFDFTAIENITLFNLYTDINYDLRYTISNMNQILNFSIFHIDAIIDTILTIGLTVKLFSTT